jgi:hypothetical protein
MGMRHTVVRPAECRWQTEGEAAAGPEDANDAEQAPARRHSAPQMKRT